VISPEKALAWGMTGAMLRGSDVAWDLRKKRPYAMYDKVDFDIPVGTNGDCYDRYLVRMAEMQVLEDPIARPLEHACHVATRQVRQRLELELAGD